MALFARVLTSLPLAAALMLSACGGGGSSSPTVSPVTPVTPVPPAPATPTPPAPATPTPPAQQAGPGVAVGEPSPSAPVPVVAQFVARAQQASCADTSNKLYVIDQKYAFLARTGRCADASYAYELFGATPEAPLCSRADTIAGPRTTCTDEKVRTLFDTLVANLDKPSLGLGNDHKVDAVTIPAKDGTPLAFDLVATDASSGIHGARKVVVRDAAALNALWAEHNAGRDAAPALPQVDFSTQMLIAVFAGDGSACREFGVRRVLASGTKIAVDVVDRVDPAVMCVAVVTAPMQMVVVARSDAEVVFNSFTAERLPFAAIQGGRTEFTGSAMRVIKDAAAWSALWAAHSPATKAPAIDFARQMVVAVFLGSRPNGCNGVGIEGIYRAAGKIGVNVTEFVAGPGIMCTQAIVFPYIMVTLDRSDEPVEFWTQTRQLR